MPPLLRLLTTALVTYRLTRLITEDVITEPIRDAIFDRFGDPSTPAARYTPSFAVTCPHCASLYAAVPAAALTLLAEHHPSARLVSLALASAAAVSIYHDHVSTRTSTQHQPTSGWA